MGLVRMSGAIVVCLGAFGSAWAHGGFSFSAPARVQVSHGQSYHGKTSYRTTVVVNAPLAGGGLYAGGEEVSELTVFSVPSAAERYRNATGRALPASHSNILLPPTTANGDYTTIWENNGPE